RDASMDALPRLIIVPSAAEGFSGWERGRALAAALVQALASTVCGEPCEIAAGAERIRDPRRSNPAFLEVWQQLAGEGCGTAEGAVAELGDIIGSVPRPVTVWVSPRLLERKALSRFIAREVRGRPWITVRCPERHWFYPPPEPAFLSDLACSNVDKRW